jgi:hypothetical protein
VPRSPEVSANGNGSTRSETATPPLPAPVFEDKKHDIKIFQGDCLEILPSIPADSTAAIHILCRFLKKQFGALLPSTAEVD